MSGCSVSTIISQRIVLLKEGIEKVLARLGSSQQIIYDEPRRAVNFELLLKVSLAPKYSATMVKAMLL